MEHLVQVHQHQNLDLFQFLHQLHQLHLVLLFQKQLLHHPLHHNMEVTIHHLNYLVADLQVDYFLIQLK